MLSQNDIAYLTKKREEIVYKCPLCHGRRAFCKCQYAFQFEYTKIRANIPIPIRDFSLDEVTHSRLQSVKNYAIQFVNIYQTGAQTGNLIVSGTNDRVTTGLAVYVLTTILRMKRSGYYFPSLFDAKSAAAKNWSVKEKGEPDCVALNTADVIVIAGFGTGTESGSAAYEELREIVKNRGANGRLTIFVSRKNFSSLPEQEKSIIGSCRAAEMLCYNWGCTEEADTASDYFVPEAIGGLTEQERKEKTRINTLKEANASLQDEEISIPKYVKNSVLKYKKKPANKGKKAAAKKGMKK